MSFCLVFLPCMQHDVVIGLGFLKEAIMDDCSILPLWDLVALHSSDPSEGLCPKIIIGNPKNVGFQ